MLVSERFLKYVTFDTQSNEENNACPSSEGQWLFANYLVEELKNIGLEEVNIDKNCYITATLPANVNIEVPCIGFIAHLDTSPEVSGKNIKPLITRNYNGEDIILNNEGLILSSNEFPELNQYIGQDIITSDGTTLLGADDKAGIAEIVTAMEFFIQHPEIKHGKIRIGFTPDEEIGRGADLFDVKNFGASWAYTIDGGEIGELEYENFNAASATITITGQNVHPGYAKNKMINAIEVGNKFCAMLPEKERPEHTDKYEGFYHLISFEGTVEKVVMRYIIRDFEYTSLQNRMQLMTSCIEKINQCYGKKIADIFIEDQYQNMKEIIDRNFHIIDNAKLAMMHSDVRPQIKPIRGGTDGARLSFMGLPCPNIFTGGHNFHSRYEFIPIQSMEKCVNVILELGKI